MEEPTGSWTVSGLGNMVADTDQFAGGGVVAAMSLVGAAATSELVFQLSARRRGLHDSDREQLHQAIERSRQLRARFLQAIDHDMDCLTALMDAQRQSRRARKAPDEQDQQRTAIQLNRAVQRAIRIPLDVARDASTLLDDIETALPLARTFTVSDLGAAAATTQGAIVSLVLMAEVNLGMLEDQEELNRLGTEISDLRDTVSQRSRAIIERTRQLITARDNRDGI